MKKLLIAAAASLLILCGQAETSAAPVDDLNVSSVETQNMSAWPRIRDSLLGRDNHSRHDHRDDHRDYRHGHHSDYRDEHRHGHGHNPPPPPPRRR